MTVAYPGARGNGLHAQLHLLTTLFSVFPSLSAMAADLIPKGCAVIRQTAKRALGTCAHAVQQISVPTEYFWRRPTYFSVPIWRSHKTQLL